MYNFTLLISGLLAHTFTSPKIIKQTETHTKLDPRGLVRSDINFIRKHIRGVHYQAGRTSIEDIAYAQGQNDAILFIEQKVIGRRTDG